MKYGVFIYVCYEIVYNKYVVENFKVCGVIFVEEVDEILVGVVMIFSVYGVVRKVELNLLE